MKGLEHLQSMVNAGASLETLCRAINGLKFKDFEPQMQAVAYRSLLEGPGGDAVLAALEREALALSSVDALLKGFRLHDIEHFLDRNRTLRLPRLPPRRKRKGGREERLVPRASAPGAFDRVLCSAAYALALSRGDRDTEDLERNFGREWQAALEWAKGQHSARGSGWPPTGGVLHGHAYLRRVLFEDIAPKQALCWTDLAEDRDLFGDEPISATFMCVTEACLVLYWTTIERH